MTAAIEGRGISKTAYPDKIRISQSVFIDYDLGEHFDDAYLMVIREIIEKLKEMGRTTERIVWEQGNAIPGKPFPLSPEYDGGTHHFITASCRIPIANLNLNHPNLPKEFKVTRQGESKPLKP